MTNKQLAFTILGMVLVFVGGIYTYNWQVSKNPKDSFGNYAYQTPDKEVNKKDEISEAPKCERKFDSSKLKATSMNINNREVEMDVKGFGKIKLAFYEKDAPKAVENFLKLVDSGYYDCLTFHRVAKGFVIQGGDPNGNGTGGESAFGVKFADELNPKTESYKQGYMKGTLAMANSGPNTNGSQFFIMLEDVPLDHLYTIFGKVTSGIEVVEKIGQVDIIPQNSATDGMPKQPVVIESVKIVK